MKRVLLLLAAFFTAAQLFSQYSVTGKVTDENGNPLPGANVYFEGEGKGTTTNQSGKYLLTGEPDSTYKLIISFLGYQEYTQDITLDKNKQLDVSLTLKSVLAEEVIVSGIRAGEKTPTTYSFVTNEEIEAENLGQDVPYLLAMEPSTIITSDAGAGIGYTGLSVRGIDSREINVTINGMPFNNPESYTVYWVDLPDIAGSSEGIQIQRGIGTSTNGTATFGGSINLNTKNISKSPFLSYSSSYGSFNSSRNAVSAGTGLVKNHWFLEGKYNLTKSDGYRDRAWSDLSSYFLQTGYYGEKTIVKLIAFGGLEETYQAWYSVTQDEIDLYGRTFNPAGAIYDENYEIIDYYDNFIDHYKQDNIQLHLLQQVNSRLHFNIGLTYTHGAGYYEEYMQEELLNYYPMPFYNLEPLYFDPDSTETAPGEYAYFYHDSIYYSDVVRRLWLDNDLYGATWSGFYNIGKLSFIFGGAYHLYTHAKHFGKVVWARYASTSLPGQQFYFNESEKQDINGYLKANYQLNQKISLFADLQIRHISYQASGLDREWTDGDVYFDIDKNYTFFNPKLGASFEFIKGHKLYTYVAQANREPNRSDFLDAPDDIEPKHETLNDMELGYRGTGDNYKFELVLYNMQYKNQLAFTGKLNDVGDPIRKNVGESFRRGIEVTGVVKPVSWSEIGASITWSDNRTSYKEYNTEDSTFINYENMTLSYSPTIIAKGFLNVYPIYNMVAGIRMRHVGSQFVDNSENDDLKLPAYTVADFTWNYSFTLRETAKVDLSFTIHNMLDAKYSSNGVVHYTRGLGLFPQAGRHYMAGIKLKI